MHPVLFTLPLGEGGFAIHIYGLMGALGFLLGLGWATRSARAAGLDPDLVLNLCLGVLLCGLVGSRVLFLALNWEIFAGNIPAMLNLRDGGLVFMGGLPPALAFTLWYARARGLPVLRAGDVIVPGLALGHGVGRIGCLAAGCCYGKPTDLPWGITFDPSSVGPIAPGVHYHPVQVYEFAVELAIFLALARLFSRRRFDGQVFAGYFLLYGGARFSLELLRGDVVERGFFLPALLGELLSTSQGISVVQVLLAAGGYVWLSRRPSPLASS